MAGAGSGWEGQGPGCWDEDLVVSETTRCQTGDGIILSVLRSTLLGAGRRLQERVLPPSPYIAQELALGLPKVCGSPRIPGTRREELT